MDAHSAFKMYFERKKKSSAGFSLRALAHRLKISPSFLSRTLSGKKPIPVALQSKLAEALDIEPELLSHTHASRAPRVNPAIDDWELAEAAASRILRNWYYVPILELTTLTDFDGSAEQISRRLRLSTQTTEIALREMVSLGLLSLRHGKYHKTQSKLRFTSAKTTEVIRRFHDEMLEKAQQELRTATGEEEFHSRLISGITISCTPEAVQEAKRKLAQCLHEIANDLTATPGSEVYHLAVQLFPLTKKE